MFSLFMHKTDKKEDNDKGKESIHETDSTDSDYLLRVVVEQLNTVYESKDVDNERSVTDKGKRKIFGLVKLVQIRAKLKRVSTRRVKRNQVYIY